MVLRKAKLSFFQARAAMIDAVIFDMDGLLIDSEPLWQEAEILVFKQVNIILTPSMCLQTKGLRIDEVVDYWYKKYPWKNTSKQEIEAKIVAKVIELVDAKVEQAIFYVQEQDVKIALASSSAYKIINVVLEKLNLSSVFEVIYSAESEPLGKPHPGVYLTTAHKLGISPLNCLALEDSLNGVLAAKAAQMKCIAIPEVAELSNPKFAIADIILSSLVELNESIWDMVNNN